MNWSNPLRRIGHGVFGLAGALLVVATIGTVPAWAQVTGGNANVTIIAPIPSGTGEVNTISGDVGGGVLYAYIGVIFTWLAGIVGLVLLCFVVFYGFLLMFAGIEDKTEEAKKGLTASLGGLILLMCSGLLLYTLNPNFFGGFGDDTDPNDVILGTGGGGYTEPTKPTEPTEPTEPTKPTEPGTPAPAGSCAKVRQTPCSNISSRTKQLAQQILDSKAIGMDSGSTLLPGSGPRQNLQDLVKGMCPLVQDFSNNTTGCEKDTAKINAEVVNAEKILSAILAIPKGPIKSIYITSLFGGTHAALTHRHFQAADLGIVNGWTVANSSDAKVCTYAKALRDNTGAPTVFGPQVLGRKNECGDNIGFCAGHNNHYHVDVKGVSCGGVRYLQGTSEEVEFESAHIDLPE